MRKFDLSLRSSRSSYFATFRHQLTILSKTDALDEEKWLNMLGTFVEDWFRYESPFVHGNQILKQNAKREMRLRLGKVTVADVLAAQPVTTNLLKFMRASIKMIGVSNLQSFIASMTQKLTL